MSIRFRTGGTILWAEISMDFPELVNENQTLNYMIRNSCDFRNSRFEWPRTNTSPVGEVRNVLSINIFLESEVADFHIDVVKYAIGFELSKLQHLDNIRMRALTQLADFVRFVFNLFVGVSGPKAEYLSCKTLQSA